MPTLKLTDEMRQALQEHPGQPLEIEDEQTRQVYLLVAKPAESPQSCNGGRSQLEEHEAIDWDFSIDNPPPRPEGTLHIRLGDQVESSPPMIEDPFA